MKVAPNSSLTLLVILKVVGICIQLHTGLDDTITTTGTDSSSYFEVISGAIKLDVSGIKR